MNLLMSMNCGCIEEEELGFLTPYELWTITIILILDILC